MSGWTSTGSSGKERSTAWKRCCNSRNDGRGREMSARGSTMIGAAACALASIAAPSADAADAGQGHGAYAAVNGLRMYYETYGPATGVPLVLLHGGGSTIDSTFGRIIPFLARDRRVIAIEEQAHGRTSDRDAPVRFDTSADDVASLLDVLHV